MKLSLAQLDPVVGDLDGNAARIRAAIDTARSEGADLLITPELSILGYPPRDLLGRRGLVDRCEQAVAALAHHAVGITALVGHPRRARADEPSGSRPLRNSLSAVRDGRIIATYDKRLLPSYDVFDEDRHFGSGREPVVIDVAGHRVGLLLCEDLWAATDVDIVRDYTTDCVGETIGAGAEIIAIASASPFIVGKRQRHLARLRELALRHRTTLASVNQVGGKDDLLFDGASALVGPNGALLAALPGWRAASIAVDTGRSEEVVAPWPTEEEADLFEALVMGVRDYFRTCGLTRAVIGLSGGVDSALTATIAVAALGAEAVCGVLMPSRHSSTHSVVDAIDLATRVHLRDVRTIPIEQAHATLRTMIESGDAAPNLDGLPDENLQSRVRGTIVMTIANASGGAALATGNKSELATGYCTLYGDMIGAVAPLGDLTKTRVWALCRWINMHHAECGFATPPIPQSSIDKEPSAELRPDQRDVDALLPYPILDAIVEAIVDRDLDIESAAAATGRPLEEVRRIARMIALNEHKRRQAPLVLKVSPRAFGPGRRMPLAMRWEFP